MSESSGLVAYAGALLVGIENFPISSLGGLSFRNLSANSISSFVSFGKNGSEKSWQGGAVLVEDLTPWLGTAIESDEKTCKQLVQ